jgi:hypothetical protein
LFAWGEDTREMIEKDGRFVFKAWCSGTSSDTGNRERTVFVICRNKRESSALHIGVTAAESFLKANRQSAQKANDS